MRIAISATAPSLDAEVDPRFGRCQHFVIIDPDTLDFEAIQNTSQMASGGAGIASAQLIASKEVQAVLTGNCGPNAHQALEAAGIEVITGISGKVRNAVEQYKAGRCPTNSGPRVETHFGTVGANTRGEGFGMGRGMGGGRGRGIARSTDKVPNMTDQELVPLKSRTQDMGKQLSDVMRRLDELEKR